MKQNIFILLVAFLLVNSCKKEDVANDTYIIFGHFYGECFGEQCIEIFKIENEKLYEDLLDIYPTPSAPYNGNFELLNDEKYKLVSDLMDKVPQALLLNIDTVIGQPDAGDWGGFYFEVKQLNVHKYWLIDNNENNLPSELIPFKDVLNNYIDRISD